MNRLAHHRLGIGDLVIVNGSCWPLYAGDAGIVLRKDKEDVEFIDVFKSRIVKCNYRSLNVIRKLE